MKKDKPMPKIVFTMMSFIFGIRDKFLSPQSILEEAGVAEGSIVLDYGCGPGSFSLAAAEIVGDSGKVYSLDIHPDAIRRVKKKAVKQGFTTIETILSDGDTGLKNDSIDIILFYDTYHLLGNPNNVLCEMHRILKPDGILSFSNHHMKDEDIILKLTAKGLFYLSMKGKHTYTFLKKS